MAYVTCILILFWLFASLRYYLLKLVKFMVASCLGMMTQIILNETQSWLFKAFATCNKLTDNIGYCLALIYCILARYMYECELNQCNFDLKYAHFIVFLWSIALQIKFQVNWKTKSKFRQTRKSFVIRISWYKPNRHHYFLYLFICPFAYLPTCHPNSPPQFTVFLFFVRDNNSIFQSTII